MTLVNEPIILPLPANPLAAKFAHLHDQVAAELFEMNAEIHAILLALLTFTNVVVISEPGEGKTTVTRRVAARIEEIGLYENEFGPFTDINDVFGPLDMPTFRQTGAYVRRTDNYAPDNQLNIWDEGLNASEGLQRSCHGLALDRKYSKDGLWVPAKTRCIVILSNDPPQSKSTRAFFDRILQRLWRDGGLQTDSLIKAFEAGTMTTPAPVMTWAEVVAAHDQIDAMPVSKDVSAAVAAIHRQLASQGIHLSTRRVVMSKVLLQAEAWLEGADEVTIDHLPILVNSFVTTKDQIPIVEEVVLDFANPLEKESLKLLAELDQIGVDVTRGIEATDKEQKTSIGRECFTKLKRCRKDLNSLRTQAGTSRRQLANLTAIKDKAHALSSDVLTKVFEQDLDGPVQMPNFDG